jgi:protein-S-isoprenylcysteine O-methyltransferase Ste14
MYGFPLTIYILAWLFGYRNPDSSHLLKEVVGTQAFWEIVHPASDSLVLLSAILIALGWWKIYNAKEKFVTNGIYAMVRHPQYLGFLLLTAAMLIHWVTLPTLLMYPILSVLYYRLARDEEKDMQKKFEDEYLEYERRVPMLVPSFTNAASATMLILILAPSLFGGAGGTLVGFAFGAVAGLHALLRRISRGVREHE